MFETWAVNPSDALWWPGIEEAEAAARTTGQSATPWACDGGYVVAGWIAGRQLYLQRQAANA